MLGLRLMAKKGLDAYGKVCVVIFNRAKVVVKIYVKTRNKFL